MLPSVDRALTTTLEVAVGGSKNYKMYVEEEIVHGYREDLEAMQQVVYKILNTQRYQYIIYSWNYGVELADLFGEPISYVCPELERRIKEALIQDDRITSVDSFSFEILEKRKVCASFTVHTIFGDIKAERQVDY